MKEPSSRKSTNKSGKSVSGSFNANRRGTPLRENKNNNNKKGREGYVRDDDWGTTEMRLRGIKK